MIVLPLENRLFVGCLKRPKQAEITWLHNVGCILQETVEDYPFLKALVADLDTAVTRMTI